MKYFFILFLIFSGCVKNRAIHKTERRHTHKLIRPLAIAFLSKNEVFVKVGDFNLHSLTLEIFHQTKDSKALVYKNNLERRGGPITIELQEGLEEQGGILAAVVKGLDSNNQEISSSASYVLGEQDEINSIKQIILKN